MFTESGHAGFNRCLLILKDKYYIRNIKAEIRRVLDACGLCNELKKVTDLGYAVQQPFEAVSSKATRPLFAGLQYDLISKCRIRTIPAYRETFPYDHLEKSSVNNLMFNAYSDVTRDEDVNISLAVADERCCNMKIVKSGKLRERRGEREVLIYPGGVKLSGTWVPVDSLE